MSQARDSTESGESAAVRAYSHVRDLVLSGRLSPGTRLVTRTLATAAGTSLNPVREALGRLASEGIVEHVPGAGAFVRRLGRRDIYEIYGMREALESYAAEQAARLINEEELEELDAICNSWREHTRELRSGVPPERTEVFVRRWVENTRRFHSLLVEAARNTILVRSVETFRLQETVFVYQRRLSPLPLGEAARTWASHVRLVRALRRGDGFRAAEIVREQMKAGRRFMLARLREEEE